MPAPEKTTQIECEIVDDTEKAIRIKTENGVWWIPRSQITNEDDLPERGHAAVRIRSWLVEQEEIH